MKPINTGICSFGMSGKVFHAPFIQLHPGFHFSAVWERSKKQAEEKYPGVKSVGSLEELLSDDKIELIVVNTPNYTHYDYTKKALIAGKHVIVEKPFTTTVAEAEELKTLAEKQNVLLSVYQNRRWDSDYSTVKSVVQQNLLGDIVEAEFHFDRYNTALSPKLHKENPGPGAGVLYDLGPHIIDQALHLFGMPSSVFADINIQRPISQVEDYFEILLFYPQLRVRLKAGYLVREPIPSFVVHGAIGSFLKTRADVQEPLLVAGAIPAGDDWGTEPTGQEGLLHTEKDGEVIREKYPTLKGNYMAYYEGIYQAIRNNQPVPVSAADGLNVIRIIEAAYKSDKQKKVIDL